MSSNFTIPDPSTYWKSITSDIPKELLNGPLLYMLRIYLEKHDKYMYKLGFTEDFHKRLITLNAEYGACGRIVPIILARCGQQKKERSAHKKLQNLYRPMKIGFVLHKELYQISPEVYDAIKAAILGDKILGSRNAANKSVSFWESERYCIDDKRDKQDIANSNKNLPFFELFDNIYLCQDDNEADFWDECIYG